MINKLILALIIYSIISCKNETSTKKKFSETNIKTECNGSSLMDWANQERKHKSHDFGLAKKIDIIFSSDTTSASVIWRYDVKKTDFINDEYVQYCLNLIEEKKQIPSDYRIKFDYMLNGYCPVAPDLPIEVYSEIQGLSLIDIDSNIIYEFDVIRGRIDSGIKIIFDDSKKSKDTTYLEY